MINIRTAIIYKRIKNPPLLMVSFDDRQEVEERILLQEHLAVDLYMLAPASYEFEKAKEELQEQRRETLEILEKTVWMEKNWFERIGLQIIGKKHAFLEGILNDPAYRAHALCQGPLRRYDLYQKQVQIGEVHQEIYHALKKFAGKITNYQEEWKEKMQHLRSNSEHLRQIEQIKATTQKKEEILSSLQEHLQNYLFLPEDQQKKLQEAIHSLVVYREEKEWFTLDDALTRHTLCTVAEELKAKNRTEMYRHLDQKEILCDEKNRLEDRLKAICTSIKNVHIEFQHLKREGYVLKHDFQALGVAKTGELLDPQIIEQIETAEKHHQEALELLKKDTEAERRAVQSIKFSHEGMDEVQALLRGEKNHD